MWPRPGCINDETVTVRRTCSSKGIIRTQRNKIKGHRIRSKMDNHDSASKVKTQSGYLIEKVQTFQQDTTS
jgi:hypothetical protein